jgi:hypothetical protein
MKRNISAARISQTLHRLGRSVGLTINQMNRLGKLAITVNDVRNLTVAQITRTLSVDKDKAAKLIAAAHFAVLPDMPLSLATRFARDGMTIDDIANDSLSQLLERYKATPGVTARRLVRWGVAASSTYASVAPKFGAAKAPAEREVLLPRKVIVTQESTWRDVAESVYGLRDDDAESWAASLALVNRSQPDERIRSGAVALLPVKLEMRPHLPQVEEGVQSLREFAPYLDDHQAMTLATEGFLSPKHLIASVWNPSVLLNGACGMGAPLMRQLQTHAVLSAMDEIGPEVAYYLSITRPRTLQELAVTEVFDLAAEIERAVILDELIMRDDTHYFDLARRIVGSIVNLFPKWPFPLPGEGSVCSRDVPSTAHIENYYSIRFAPAGHSAEMLRLELSTKNQWLAEVDDYFAQAEQAQQTSAHVERGLQIARINLDDLRQWGGNIFNATRIETLTLLRDFIRDNARIVDLLASLADGHESFHVREYGLALAAYERVETWFTTLAPRQDPPEGNEIWWRNQIDNNVFKPAFLYYYEQMAGSLAGQLTYKPVHDYYGVRAAAHNRSSVLDHLHIELTDYNRYRLAPALIGAPAVPFTKFLYYVHNFLLPLAKGDCYAKLGNFCEALDLYMRVYSEESLINRISPTDESTIVSNIRGGAGPSYPSLTSFAVAVPANDQYYPAYLNDVERRVVRLRVAELLLAWGDDLYRRRDTASAQARYAQVIRILYSGWKALVDLTFSDSTAYRTSVNATGVNPRAAALAFTAHHQLLKIARGLNFLGYAEDYVPIWTYRFLLTSARYFAERARQLGRDAVQFLGAAEQEQGNRRLLQQQVGVAQGQLAVESRRVDEAEAASAVAQAGVALADQRAANNASAKEDLEAFGPTRQALGIVGGALAGAGSGSGIGGLAGPTGAAAGAVAGATYGAVSSYVSGCVEMQAQRNELERQRLELQKASAMSAAELNRSRVGISVATLARNVAALHTIHAQSNLEFAQAKTLSAEFWYETAARVSDIATDYLERAIGISFLTEQSFEFLEGRQLDVIRFDYSQTEGVLSAEALLSDLDSIEFERISGRVVKSMPVKNLVRLREKDFSAFLDLKRYGKTTFDTSLFELDASHPGTYDQHIAGVEVEIRALVPPEGIRGTLRKGGLSYFRYRVGAGGTAAAPPNTQPDWIQYSPSDFRIAPVLQSPETLVLSPFDTRRDTIMLRADPGEQLRVFEGSGIGTSWTLTLMRSANAFDFATITDVNLIVYFNAQFDEDLASNILLERRKLSALGSLPLQRTRGFSLREAYPDQMYALQNPSPETSYDAWQQRVITFNVREGQFPPLQRGRMLHGLSIYFIGPDGSFLDIKGELADVGHIWAVSDFVAEPGLDANVRSASGEDRDPVTTWRLTLRASDNVTSLGLPGKYAVHAGRVVLDDQRRPVATPGGVDAFDEEKLRQLKDIVIIFNYRYREADAIGDPVTLWAHFAAQQNPTFVNAGTAVETTWLGDSLNGSPSWSIVQGFMTQTAAAGGILAPAAQIDWLNVSAFIRVNLPSQAGCSGGVVLRFKPQGGGLASGDFCMARMTRLVGGDVEFTIEDRLGGTVNVLGRMRSTGLGSLRTFDLEFRAEGSSLRAGVNGKTFVNASETSIMSGSVGLFAEGQDVSFEQLIVSQLE